MEARDAPLRYAPVAPEEEATSTRKGRAKRLALGAAGVLVAAVLVVVAFSGSLSRSRAAATATVDSQPISVLAEKKDSKIKELEAALAKAKADKAKKQADKDGGKQKEESVKDAKCLPRFQKPDKKPSTAMEHAGVKMPDACFTGDGPFHVFIIGDWGGMVQHGKLSAVSHLNHRWNQSYKFIWPIDLECQFRVSDQMNERAPISKPDYILNVGDNFYWGGIEDYCGNEDISKLYSNGGTNVYKKNHVQQFKSVFEDVYKDPRIVKLQWLGVLGNHDWGGWRFDMGWDQAIGYTWYEGETVLTKDRWLTPALYYYVTVRYPDFVVDYYFMDTNVFDALPYGEKPPHNICGPHNPKTASCKSTGGPPSVDGCQQWFHKLWQDQKDWLDDIVPKSEADWRMVVTHFPPYWGHTDWQELAKKHELDVIITGHRHSQKVHVFGDDVEKVWEEDVHDHKMTDFLDPSAWIVSGGGGGITSEHVPDTGGNDDQYGFVDMTLTKEKLTFEAISHGGQIRRKVDFGHWYSHGGKYKVVMPKKEKKCPKGKKGKKCRKAKKAAKAKEAKTDDGDKDDEDDDDSADSEDTVV